MLKTKNNINKLNDILDLWMKDGQLKWKQSTQDKYNFLISKHIAPKIGDIPITQLTSFFLNDFIHEKVFTGNLNGHGGLSPSYVRTIATIIQSVLQYAFDNDICSPFNLKLVKPISTKSDIKILTVHEQKLFEDYLLNNMTYTNLGIFLSLNTGLRIGEVCALSWDNIDLSERVMHIKNTVSRINCHGCQSRKTINILDTPKTKSSHRDIPISTKIFPLLKSMYPAQNNIFVISNNDKFLNPRTFEYRFHNIIKKIGIKEINYHVLRHTFATRCIEKGVDIKALSEILGHSNISITMNTYVHSSIEHKRNQLEKLYI